MHPRTGKPIELECPLPVELQSFVERAQAGEFSIAHAK